jgi:hypothetical protein
VRQEVREFATTYPALLALLDWFSAQRCPVVAMESTGAYWPPVYHVFAGTVEVLVGNAHEMRRRRDLTRVVQAVPRIKAHGLGHDDGGGAGDRDKRHGQVRLLKALDRFLSQGFSRLQRKHAADDGGRRAGADQLEEPPPGERVSPEDRALDRGFHRLCDDL